MVSAISSRIGNRNHVKGLPPLGNDFSALPNRVRHDEIQQSALFVRLLLFEQPVHVLREFEQPDACFHILAVRRAESLDLGQDARLFLAALARFALILRYVDPAVEPVFVHQVEAILEPQMVLLELGDAFIAEPLLVAVTFAQRCRYPGDDAFVDGDAPEHRAVSFLQRFLPDVRLRAFSARAGAVVVDVFLLLDLAYQCESARAALQ